MGLEISNTENELLYCTFTSLHHETHFTSQLLLIIPNPYLPSVPSEMLMSPVTLTFSHTQLNQGLRHSG